MNDKRCKVCGCLIPDDAILCCRCGDYNDMQTFKPRIQTNGDRIRAMTNIELAAFIYSILTDCGEGCDTCQIGKIGGICNMHTIHAWIAKEANKK